MKPVIVLFFAFASLLLAEEKPPTDQEEPARLDRARLSQSEDSRIENQQLMYRVLAGQLRSSWEVVQDPRASEERRKAHADRIEVIIQKLELMAHASSLQEAMRIASRTDKEMKGIAEERIGAESGGAEPAAAPESKPVHAGESEPEARCR